MRPPLAGKRESARRLAEELRRRLEPVARILPVRLPGPASASDRSAAAGDEHGGAAAGVDEHRRAAAGVDEHGAAAATDDVPGAAATVADAPASRPLAEPDAAAEPTPAADTPTPFPSDAATSPPAPADGPDLAARLDAARARLRETITPPGDRED